MINLTDEQLANAELIYLVSNTPSFIVRKMREDTSVQKLSREFSSDDLKRGIVDSLSVEPKTLKQLVLPFLLAIALDLKNESIKLRDFINLNTSKYPGFREALAFILANSRSVSTYTVSVKPSVRISSSRISSAKPSLPNKLVNIDLR